jgi:hypothetical protein
LYKESPFQTISFLGLYEGLKKIKPFRIEVEVNNQCVAYSNLIVFDSSPFLRYAVIYDNPVYTTESELLLLIQEIINKCKQYSCIFLELRLSQPDAVFKANWESSGFSSKPWYNAILSLDTALPRRISASKKRNVEASIRLGYTQKECSSSNELWEAYCILKGHYKRINKPLPEYKFFDNIFQAMQQNRKGLPKNAATILISLLNQRVISASVVLLSANTASQFYFASTKLPGLLHPGSFHQWSMIEWAAANKYQWIDLVGGGDPRFEYGVREFKRRFGANFTDCGRYTYVFKPIQFRVLWTLRDFLDKFKRSLGAYSS